MTTLNRRISGDHLNARVSGREYMHMHFWINPVITGGGNRSVVPAKLQKALVHLYSSAWCIHC